ncbi:MAG: hypothetical protein LPK11_01390 [Chromatiaceae bacterium]|nr:hypothetical protein [Chromatiaceae bacterium]
MTNPQCIQKVSAEHILKKEKELACDYDNLTHYDVMVLTKYCSETQSNLATHTLLASLFTGRSIEDLLNKAVTINASVSSGFGTLHSTIEHPRSPCSSGCDKINPEVDNAAPYIFLPSTILVSILSARAFEKTLIDQLNSYLAEINKNKGTRLTLGRIKRYLFKEAACLNISQTEACWISNTRLRDHAGSSYLSMSSTELALKHYRFINNIMLISGLGPFDVLKLLDCPNSKERIGSNRALSDQDLQNELTKIKLSVQEAYSKFPATIWQIFNTFTHYAVTLLNLCTSHRSTRAPYGTLDNFDLIRKVVWIEDKKARTAASRLIPLNSIGTAQIQYYISFLSKFYELVKYSYPIDAEHIQMSLKSEADLFSLRGRSGMTFYSNTNVREICDFELPSASNWNRHWIKQFLATQSRVDATAVDAFMGHENLLDESFSRFSNLDTAELRKIVDAIEKRLINLNVQALEVSL